MIKHIVTTIVYLNDKSYKSDVVIEEYDIHEFIKRKKIAARPYIYMDFNSPINGKLYARSWEHVFHDKWSDYEMETLYQNNIPYYSIDNGTIIEKNSPIKII